VPDEQTLKPFVPISLLTYGWESLSLLSPPRRTTPLNLDQYQTNKRLVPVNPYSGFEIGGVVEPLSIVSSNSLLQDSDPALFYMLDFFAYVINTYPGPRLLQAASAANLPVASAVAQKYPVSPQSEFQQNQFRFPLLCVARKRTQSGRLTASWERDRNTFELTYALPPLDPGQAEAIMPILAAVARDLRHKTTQGFDPGYTPPGGTAGQSPWAVAGVQDIGFGDPYRDLVEIVSYGYLEGAGNLFFPCIVMNGYFSERDMYNRTAAGAVKFAGGDITADLQASDGTVIAAVIQSSTQQAPTVTSLSVTSGTHLGGTAVTITGTLFLPGATVLFGNAYSTSVTWNSATSISCTTPVMQGAGAYALAVTVTNPDGQVGTLPLAFTFT
jgi:hypothetical protein